MHAGACLTDRAHHSRQRVRGVDLVVPISAHEQEVVNIGRSDEVFEEIEGGRVEPLQIVEEERERVLRPGEDAEEAPEDRLKAAPSVVRREVGDRRLPPEDDLELGDEVHDQLAIRTERFAQSVP